MAKNQRYGGGKYVQDLYLGEQVAGARSIVDLENERDDYRTRALHWRTECDKRDKKINELETFLRSLMSRIEEQLQ